MFTDFHTHVLPGIDDGASDTAMSLKMLKLMKEQGTDVVVATPHFYAHHQSIADFVDMRSHALQSIAELNTDGPIVIPGAEVYLERDIRHQDLKPLCIGNTSYILVEMPYSSFSKWMAEEVYNFCLQQSLIPVFAHLNRFTVYYSEEDIQSLLQIDNAVVQVNNSDLYSHRGLKTVLGWLKDGVPVIIGSDCHNITTRAPDNDHVQSLIKAKFGKDWLKTYGEYAKSLLDI